MSMLLFMPWCRIDRPYAVDNIEILPFQRQRHIDGLDDLYQCRANTIMATYKTIEGRPVDRAALIRHGDKAIIDDLTDEELDDVFDLAALACFSGLAGRDFFDPVGAYCNSDCFSLYVQKFANTDFSALVTRRREGRTTSAWPIDDISVIVPVHCQTVTEVTLDESLLRALLAYRGQCIAIDWARWQNAISSFNQANTDGESVRYQVEWVLLSSAFEHLLDAKPRANDVATRFINALVPSEEVRVHDVSRRSTTWTDDAKPLRYEWMREFYRIRGDFAHGRLNTRQPVVWNPLEHIVLAAIAFPLLVRCLLSSSGLYEISEEDRVQIDSFESLADTVDFLQPPAAWQSNMDSHWDRVRRDRRRHMTVQRAVEHYAARRTATREPDTSPEADEPDIQE